MIKEIKITNFLSFGSQTIYLSADTNILVGINGSGKSNFLKAIRLLKEGVAGMGLKKYILDTLGGFDNIYFKNKPPDTILFSDSTPMFFSNTNYISIEYVFDWKAINTYGFKFTEDITYKIELFKNPSIANYYVKEKIQNTKGFIYLDFSNGEGVLNERDPEKKDNKKTNLKKYNDFAEPTELALSKVFDSDRYFALSSIRKAVSEIVVYDYFDTTPKSAIRKPMLATSERRLLPDGTNLPQILNTLKINHKPSYSKITSMLNEVNSKFRGFDFHYLGGNIELMLDEENLESSIHVTSISDGTLRYLCLLSILNNPERGSLICIDEPEVGLHPDMIAHVGTAIISASESSTIVVSTHSENLLNCFEIEKIRVFEKDDSNSSKIFAYTKNDFEGWYDKYSAGKMWRQGDIGGNRW